MMDFSLLHRSLHVLILALGVVSVAGARDLVVSLDDPPGDDVGDGSFVYPQRGDYKPGDLDVRLFWIERDTEGFWFNAAFASLIPDPSVTSSGVGAAHQSMAATARKGFYSFNVDVYIDIDRQPGSGNQFTLPGRGVRIDPAYAWEKAVVLTPRPEIMREELLATLAEQYPSQSAATTSTSIDKAIFFPERIHVRGKTVSFFVPRSFIGGSDGSDWAVTAFVTGAKPYTSMSAGFRQSKGPLQELDLGAMQPEVGRPMDTFGYTGKRKPSAIVDLLAPGNISHAAVLASGAPLTGISWGAHAADDLRSAAAAIAAAPTILEPQIAESGVAQQSFLSNPWAALRGLFKPDAPFQMQTSDAGVPVKNLFESNQSNLLQVPKASQNDGQTMAARLQALRQLYEQKMIDELEYKQQKQRILNEL